MRMGYKAALDWLLDNDDCYWLDDHDNGSLSVTASFVADAFGKPDEAIRSDLLKRRLKRETNV